LLTDNLVITNANIEYEFDFIDGVGVGVVVGVGVGYTIGNTLFPFVHIAADVPYKTFQVFPPLFEPINENPTGILVIPEEGLEIENERITVDVVNEKKIASPFIKH